MKVEAIMTCVGRSSFLKETLPINKDKFSNIIVITTPTDYETQKICEENDVCCVETNLFYKNGASFDKGRSLNEGFKNLKYQEWVVLTDCDIVFPTPFYGVFKNTKLNKNKLYCTRRLIIESKKEFLDFTRKVAYNPELLDISSMVRLDNKELGVGFFQMFHLQSKIIEEIKKIKVKINQDEFNELVVPLIKSKKDYSPVLKETGMIHPCFPTAGGSDSQFRHFFVERSAMSFLPEPVPVIHLGQIGKGHSGVSRSFK